MSKKAIIDIGTNSVKFYMAEIKDGKAYKIIDTNNISRLGEGLRQTGVISEKAMQKNIEVVCEFVKIAKDNNADEIIGVGTFVLRTAKNTSEFIKRVEESCGLIIEVIPGKEEARLSYLAVISALPVKEGDIVVFDTGGGSTEFIFGHGDNIVKRFSINVGSVRLTEDILKSDPVKDEEIENTYKEINKAFDEYDVKGSITQLVGMGGTVTSLGAVKHKMVKYNPEIIQGSKLEYEEILNQINLYKSKTIEQRKEIPGLQPKRADVILAGACIVKTIMDRFNVDNLIISDRGLRHGLMYDRFIKK